ncbi:isocitrate/isopropylmalate family dehydrogenase [Streptomyces sp. PT12]|uniref:isocitrate/isopropylmalate family dehydrogenase n=1 Tax=Streptomyces sp. PT12 TaxID=1510197 RepID=UPI000DE2B6D3|nr:isocitrate/isopropylmalate family dehydrogenase [Streptomyces sp. PT12]RBM22158.1 isocitrate dehydrogenase [Streptomyces sp. PT12]
MKSAVGLAVGRGTGPELAAVFERVVGEVAGAYGRAVDVVRSPMAYHSYVSLRGEGGIERVRELTRADAEHYEHFCRSLAAAGVTALFRTAINAQSLYLVRQRLRAVKVDPIGAGDASMLLVRDQAQGFYTGENDHAPGTVTRTQTFSHAVTDEIVALALRRALRQWPGREVGRVVMAYKFHLLDGAFEAWVTEIAQRRGVRIELCQPDTVNRDLVEHGPAPRTVIVAGNEWGDIMHVVLLDRFGSERQESRCTENVHLDPDVAGLVEYQTVHGSADDLAGRDTVNPLATVRAAVAIAERHVGCPGAVDAAERALLTLRERGVGTRDAGGRHSTTAVVDAFLGAFGDAFADAPRAAAPTPVAGA